MEDKLTIFLLAFAALPNKRSLPLTNEQSDERTILACRPLLRNHPSNDRTNERNHCFAIAPCFATARTNATNALQLPLWLNKRNHPLNDRTNERSDERTILAASLSNIALRSPRASRSPIALRSPLALQLPLASRSPLLAAQPCFAIAPLLCNHPSNDWTIKHNHCFAIAPCFTLLPNHPPLLPNHPPLLPNHPPLLRKNPPLLCYPRRFSILHCFATILRTNDRTNEFSLPKKLFIASQPSSIASQPSSIALQKSSIASQPFSSLQTNNWTNKRSLPLRYPRNFAILHCFATILQTNGWTNKQSLPLRYPPLLCNHPANKWSDKQTVLATSLSSIAS